MVEEEHGHEEDHREKASGSLFRLALIYGATVFRLMLCPGDDVLLVASQIYGGTASKGQDQAVVPYNSPILIKRSEEDPDNPNDLEVWNEIVA